MHENSIIKMKLFREEYLSSSSTGPIRVLDVGSMSVDGHACFREIFQSPRFEYVGLDIESGKNVDLVPRDPYGWIEIPDASYDVVISGQVLEHNPQFWKTLVEIRRVTRIGGLVCLIIPSTGPIHKFPVDCWRFLPDSASPILDLMGTTEIEVFHEKANWRSRLENVWGDLCIIGVRSDTDSRPDDLGITAPDLSAAISGGLIPLTKVADGFALRSNLPLASAVVHHVGRTVKRITRRARDSISLLQT